VANYLVRAQFKGGDADRHQIPAYDGFTSLAGMGLTLSLTANYVETGVIRRRGDFEGRHTVKATPITEGSVVTDFLVSLPRITLHTTQKVLSEAAGAALFGDLFKRVVDGNLGIDSQPQTEELENLLKVRGGDVQALIAATEPSVKQTHSVIGEGTSVLNIFGASHQIAQYNKSTKEYVNGTVIDRNLLQKDVSVPSFNVNSGYGGVFDFDLGRVVPIKVTKETLPRGKKVLSWGLNEYANSTGKTVHLKFYRWLALDGRPKKYIVVDAEMPAD